MKVDGKKAYTLYKAMRYAKYVVPVAAAIAATVIIIHPTGGDPKDDPFTI